MYKIRTSLLLHLFRHTRIKYVTLFPSHKLNYLYVHHLLWGMLVKYKYKSRCTLYRSKNEGNYMFVFKVKLHNGHWTWQQQNQKLSTSTNSILFTDIIVRAGVGKFNITFWMYIILWYNAINLISAGRPIFVVNHHS